MNKAGGLVLFLYLAACSGGSDISDAEGNVSTERERGGETYTEYDERRDSYEGANGTYEGDGCTEDCSGHDAGYEWADENGIDDPDDCGGKSWSFEEGCRAYAEENGET